MTTELEKDFYKDCADKKRAACGARKKNRAGKGAVRLPSDYLPRKEMKKLMNTEVATEDLSLPMDYKAFKKLSPKNQKMQLEIWGNVYGHSSHIIAKLLGISQSTGYSVLKEAGLTELFKEKYHALKDDKSDEAMLRKKNQKLRLAEVFGIGSEPVCEADDSIIKPSATTDMSANKTAVEKLTKPLTGTHKNQPSDYLKLDMAGYGDAIKETALTYLESMRAGLEQMDGSEFYAVQMVFYKTDRPF